MTPERGELLLLLAVAVAILARRLRVPYTVGLVLAGAGLALLGGGSGIVVTKDLLFKAVIPPLVFEAAFALRWHALRRELGPIALLAVLGTLISAGVVFLAMTRLAGWDPRPAVVFAVLISATDPVSVLATFKEAGVGGRVRLLVEGESLLNDGVAAALFVLALAWSSGGSVTPLAGTLSVLVNAGLGLGCGALVALVALGVMQGTEDHLVEVTVSAGAAFGAFLLAESVHASGVMASLAAGLLVGNLGHLGQITDRGRDDAETFWEFAAFLANTAAFLLIGVAILRADYRDAGLGVAVALVAVLAGRAAAVYAVAAPLALTRWRIPPRETGVLWWGGLRGALSLALALGLPPDLPGASAVRAATFAVVAFSVVVQGLTITPLLRRLGFVPGPLPRPTREEAPWIDES